MNRFQWNGPVQDTIKRFGGSTAPSAPWPKEPDDEEEDKLWPGRFCQIFFFFVVSVVSLFFWYASCLKNLNIQQQFNSFFSGQSCTTCWNDVMAKTGTTYDQIARSLLEQKLQAIIKAQKKGGTTWAIDGNCGLRLPNQHPWKRLKGNNVLDCRWPQ